MQIVGGDFDFPTTKKNDDEDRVSDWLKNHPEDDSVWVLMDPAFLKVLEAISIKSASGPFNDFSFLEEQGFREATIQLALANLKKGKLVYKRGGEFYLNTSRLNKMKFRTIDGEVKEIKM